MSDSHVSRLRQAGVLSNDPSHLTEEHEKTINALSKEEVDTLVGIHNKLGPLHAPGHAPGAALIF